MSIQSLIDDVRYLTYTFETNENKDIFLEDISNFISLCYEYMDNNVKIDCKLLILYKELIHKLIDSDRNRQK